MESALREIAFRPQELFPMRRIPSPERSHRPADSGTGASVRTATRGIFPFRSFRSGSAVLGLALALLLCALALSPAFAQQPQEPGQQAQEPAIDPARRTPTVRLIERCLPSVVAIRAFSSTDKPDEERINLGSGTIIHPAGYILTNFHVVHSANRGEAALPGGGAYPYSL